MVGREALPSGNGTIGAAVYGAVHSESVLLTHEDLWHNALTLALPDVSDRLPEVRRLLDSKRVHEADQLLADALKDHGYQPRIGTPLFPIAAACLYLDRKISWSWK